MRSDIVKAIETFQVKTFGNKSNIESAEKLLYPDEQVLFISPTNCTMYSSNTRKKESLPGVAILTDRRFIFHYKVLLNTSTDTVTLDEIRSVNCSGNGLTGGHIEIHTIAKTYDILVTYKKDIMQKIQNTFETAKNSTVSNNSQSVSATSSADEIMKFKQLLDNGVITQEEFEAKKKQLLNL